MLLNNDVILKVTRNDTKTIGNMTLTYAAIHFIGILFIVLDSRPPVVQMHDYDLCS
jgi:hypothetical protein